MSKWKLEVSFGMKGGGFSGWYAVPGPFPPLARRDVIFFTAPDRNVGVVVREISHHLAEFDGGDHVSTAACQTKKKKDYVGEQELEVMIESYGMQLIQDVP